MNVVDCLFRFFAIAECRVHDAQRSPTCPKTEFPKKERETLEYMETIHQGRRAADEPCMGTDTDAIQCLFVGCKRPSNMLVYHRNGSA